MGVAPGSRIVSVKVAGATGETHIAQVIAAIDWVVEHKNDNGLDIRVLNLSLGMPGVTTNVGDPLSAAVERAWHAGVVVVAAVGNRGNDAGGIDSPVVSPYVIAVGAHESYDSSGAQDWIAPSSSGGNEYRQPDVVAPGRSIMSFRVPGSMLDQLYPSARVDEKYFRWSGSSQSAAVVSGFAAAVLSREPSLTPDQVKFLFEETAIDLEEVHSYVDGDGKISPKEVARSIGSGAKAPRQKHQPALPVSSIQVLTTDRSTGVNAPVESATGLAKSVDRTTGVIAPVGTTTGFAESVDSMTGVIAPVGTAVSAPSGATWSGGQWNGATWSGGTWHGATWSGATWSGATWSGATWSGGAWHGATWSGATWSGATWSGATWSGATWSGATWSSLGFSGKAWS